MNILIADKFPAHWMDALKADHKVTYTPALDENTLASAIAEAEVLLSKLSDEECEYTIETDKNGWRNYFYC